MSVFTREQVDNIDTLAQLMVACQIVKGGGYDVTLTIKTQKTLPIGEGDIILNVETNEPQAPTIDGQYWFTQDGTIIQVL